MTSGSAPKDTGFSIDDLRAGVASGVISEAQAAHLSALADARRGARTDLGGLDEPFELFKGFNEIFIVVGLGILFAGWFMLIGVSAVDAGLNGRSGGGILSGMGAIAAWLLARYFTLRRRMVAPSIVLVGLFTAMTGLAALALTTRLGLNLPHRLSAACALTGLALGLHFARFRVPITTALIAVSVFATIGALFVGENGIPEPSDLVMLTADGPFAWLTIGVGLGAFVIAMTMDMSDPHRVTRRSASAFWLHVVAAPAIVNTVALSILDGDSGIRWLFLAAFLGVMALLAIVTDRRSFLVAGVGYIVALMAYLFDEIAWAILVLGIALVLLGAQWEHLRGVILRRLPAFPGKDRLPPYAKEVS